jgi:hypothetical protein
MQELDKLESGMRMRVICRFTYWPSVGMDAAASTTAALVATLLSIDRCIALQKPLRYSSLCTTKRAVTKSVCIAVLAVSTICVSYPLRLAVNKDIGDDYSHILFHHNTQLGFNQTVKRAFSNIEFLLRFLIPLSILSISNTWTLVIMKKSSAARNAPKKTASKTKSLTLTVGLVVIFFVTQLPRASYLVHAMVVANMYRTLFYYELFILGGAFVAKLNSIVNIIVYCTLSKDFRSLLRPKTSELSEQQEG